MAVFEENINLFRLVQVRQNRLCDTWRA